MPNNTMAPKIAHDWGSLSNLQPWSHFAVLSFRNDEVCDCWIRDSAECHPKSFSRLRIRHSFLCPYLVGAYLPKLLLPAMPCCCSLLYLAVAPCYALLLFHSRPHCCSIVFPACFIVCTIVAPWHTPLLLHSMPHRCFIAYSIVHPNTTLWYSPTMNLLYTGL